MFSVLKTVLFAKVVNEILLFILELGRFRFFNFGSIRFGFQSQVVGFGFFSVMVFVQDHNDIVTSE